MGADPLGRGLILLGLLLVVVGIWVSVGPRLPWLGHLPGDLVIQRERFTFFFPLTTCLVLSVLLSLVAWLFFKR